MQNNDLSIYICVSELSDIFPRMLILEIHYVVMQTSHPLLFWVSNVFLSIVTK